MTNLYIFAEPLDLKTILGLSSSQPLANMESVGSANREDDYKEMVDIKSEVHPPQNLRSLLCDLQQVSN